ncbi:uncharacterized protein LOC129237475 [Anastrepha obliqua]|uniref:uncharacterized protein LOC129237475 n=1 Tax=Anastrepha obliqua TaxID=95512 RepID=UPI002409317B|nr:uncharacterized protein LOC129237475 [Anastrepha obliqua]
MGGDFNAKHINWGSRLTTTKGRELWKAAQQCGCEIFSTGNPTYWPTDINKTPDLIDFFVVKQLPYNIITLEDGLYLNSPIFMILDGEPKINERNLLLSNKYTDWQYFKIKLDTYVNTTNEIDNVDEIEKETIKLSAQIQKAAWLSCPPTTSSHCLRCNSEGCIKCPAYLMTDTRQCVDQCPSGYIDQWSAHTEFMGRVCVSTGYSGPLMAAIAGLIGGFVVCLTLLAVAMMLVRRRRRRKSIKQKLINENTMDRSDFLRQLNEMRPNAEYFLAMLNDTRRQIRKLYLSGEVSAANSYRPIVRDLAKILILLNRPIELIPAAPHDWNRLYTWSEQALERYKPQVGHLIDFFQPSGGGGGGVGVGVGIGSRGSGSVGISDDFDATFFPQKSNNVYRQSMLPGSGPQKLHMFGSLISLHEFDEPRPSDPFGSSFNTLKSGNLISDLNASSLWLEDEFYKLGFRPQDEITTEL